AGGRLMAQANSMLILLAILAPWCAAALAAVIRRQVRALGCAAALVAAAASSFLLGAVPGGGAVGPPLMLLFSCLTALAILVLPQRDCTPGTIAGILFILGATLLGYASQDLAVFLVAWVLTTVPFFIPRWFGAEAWRPRLAVLASTVALGSAIGLM